ncbi:MULTISPECIES: cytoplasmic protein [unclassified Neorhizobium]|uniref:cytoplasmic protein n=1 Tax=unclassified Neorhizobium TaxID=2629175 RepID=UPI001FF392D4|nr:MULTISPECIES: cytoplasmic protein [unclassified Neorhizobium]MCJ9673959.1 cytoplasmic protein [Neorhizobium sp. SHOUNA12B]MCJ9744206.1 cytoplasmic protein [Neorhizobium sp. SHOUNA12A]
MEAKSDVIVAHLHCIRNRHELGESETSGCFFCLETFPAKHVWEWIYETKDDEERLTAMCPKCGIDAVIGDASGYPVTDVRFLERMRRQWFDIPPPWPIEGTGNA